MCRTRRIWRACARNITDEYLEADVRVVNVALPDDYVEHGNVDVLRREAGIDAETVIKRIIAEVTANGESSRNNERTFGCTAGKTWPGRIQRKGKSHYHVRKCVCRMDRERTKRDPCSPEAVEIEVRGHMLKYVSRGGLKLEKAMSHFDVTLEGKVCMDVGSSTGGFTDCMLQNGAVKVYFRGCGTWPAGLEAAAGSPEWYVWRRPTSGM